MNRNNVIEIKQHGEYDCTCGMRISEHQRAFHERSIWHSNQKLIRAALQAELTNTQIAVVGRLFTSPHFVVSHKMPAFRGGATPIQLARKLNSDTTAQNARVREQCSFNFRPSYFIPKILIIAEIRQCRYGSKISG